MRVTRINLTQPTWDILIAHSRSGVKYALVNGNERYPGRPCAKGRYRQMDGKGPDACMVRTPRGYALRWVEGGVGGVRQD
jgi:hypothetical protein